VARPPGGLRALLARPVDPLPLVVFRIGFGLVLLFGAVRFLANGWVESQLIAPAFHFTYPFFSWVRPLPGDALYGVFAIQVICAALIAAGWHYRLACAGFFLAFTYVELIDQATYLNHYYFVSLMALLLAFLPLDRWGSVDARRAREGSDRFAAGAPSLAPRWVSFALQLQIAVVYFFAGLAKLNPDWLFRAQPLRVWLSARSGFPVLGPLFDHEWTAYAMSWGGAAFDLAVPLLLFHRRARPWAYVGVIGFHLMTAALFPIGIFPWVMIAATLVFFDGEDLRRFARLLWPRSVGPSRDDASPDRTPRDARDPSWAAAAFAVPALPAPPLRFGLVAFFAIQVLLPLRHLAYPGPVLWTEEGFRFSWRVMLTEKTGTLYYAVRDPATGRSWEDFPGEPLTPQQTKQMAFQPDMILVYAHHLRDRLAAEGVTDPEIRAFAHVSLNGRRSELLVDPDVDLARVARSLGPRSWVLEHPDL
jgi:vitamin K-dependent gamma-carboxylase